MARLGLDGRLADVAVARLSAGQRRRTSLAVLVARRPELWLLDEPHAGLDADRPRRWSTGWSGRGRAPAPRCCSPPTSSTGPTALADRIGHDRRRHRRGRRPRRRGRPPAARRPPPVEVDAMFRDAALVAGKDLRIELRSPGGHQPGRPVRPARADAVRLRPRPRPRHARAGHAGPVLDRGAVLAAARRAAGLRRRGGRRQPRRAAPVGPRPGRHLPRQGRRPSPPSSLALEVLLLGGVVVLYGADLRGLRLLLVADLRGRDRRAGRRRYASTACSPPACGCARRCCPLLLLPVVAPVLIGATRAFEAALGRCDLRRRLAWVGLLVVFALVYVGARHPRLRLPPGGIVTTCNPPAPTERRSRPHTDRARRGHSASRHARRHGRRLPSCSAWCCRRPTPIQGDAVPACSTSTCPWPSLAYLALRRHRARQRHVPLEAQSRSWDRSPAPRPRSAWCSPGSPWSPARSGADRPGACTGRGTPASPPPRCCSCSSSATSPLRRLPATPDPQAKRGRRSSALLAVVDVPIVHYSVDWWRTLHQGATISRSATHDRRPRCCSRSSLGIVVFAARLRVAADPPLPRRSSSRTRLDDPASTTPSPSAGPRPAAPDARADRVGGRASPVRDARRRSTSRPRGPTWSSATSLVFGGARRLRRSHDAARPQAVEAGCPPEHRRWM